MENDTAELTRKLGISQNNSAYTLHAPDHYLQNISKPITIEELVLLDDAINWMQAFYKNEQALRGDIAKLKLKLSHTGELWISWPKKSSEIQSNLTDTIVRKIGLGSGLVDIKVAAINETWSGLKFVYRTSDRKA
jgi:hypothetical protein